MALLGRKKESQNVGQWRGGWELWKRRQVKSREDILYICLHGKKMWQAVVRVRSTEESECIDVWKAFFSPLLPYTNVTVIRFLK